MKKEDHHLLPAGEHLRRDIKIAPEMTAVPGQQPVKRTFDIVFSLSVLVLSAPLLLLMATAALCSRRPLFLLTQQTGRGRKIFSLFGFNTRDPGHTELRQHWETKDPGLTTCSMLQDSGLGKLPLFFNVLMGDMSVIGPPPMSPMEMDRILSKASGGLDVLLNLKPGIISPGSMQGGHSDEEMVRQLRHDIVYLKHYSIGRDLALLFKAAVLNRTGRGTYYNAAGRLWPENRPWDETNL
jgi:lipopolysaccharide/colanic/teichoic acid biosynthesis glycosyltransferase